ncbi:MAG: Arsenical resistance operon repressor [Candidatus Latescibacteria bacterium ADurb.Bin168]|nr:MAG: Arsenical resistance operon repressor [Candidatus Latescibacteria bacterium ADurb.Bin168]
MRDLLAITKALADSNRIRILTMLRAGELCVCQIVEVLGLAPSTVSTHLSILYGAKLVESSKRGRWVYYRLADPHASALVSDCIEWVIRSVENDETIEEDREKVARVISVCPEELCRTSNQS